MRIGIIADSLALPRPGGGSNRAPVHRSETYPELLRDRARADGVTAEVIPFALRNRLMPQVPHLIEDAGLFELDALFIHVGICDCAPRVLSTRAHDFVERLPGFLRTRIVRGISRNRRRIMLVKPPAVYTSAERFRTAVATTADRLNALSLSTTAFITIAPPDEQLEHRSPGYDRHVQRYNAIIRDEAGKARVEVIDLYAVVRGKMEDLSVDGQHLNAAGNAILAQLLWASLRRSSTRPMMG